ncbi:MerR family transcriptional regulator [Terrilactibacillus laevilacticus]|uniref:MerR family transcriptional regulator n=1 Tax=Terrilactibacillus laevilacticus TaxID=1380157 RepID=A0ABW5PKP4_9BACI|nr:MerR family transcriptional regulator [Terrilactibacillus laevilacticus]
MFTISDVAQKSGLSPYTLRYYEKIGLLPASKRKEGGQRYYTENDINFILFLKSLKQTGMSLENMSEFVKDGCIYEQLHFNSPEEIKPSITKRIEILSKHLIKMEMQKKELELIISTTKEKLAYYNSIKKGDIKT